MNNITELKKALLNLRRIIQDYHENKYYHNFSELEMLERVTRSQAIIEKVITNLESKK